MLDPNQIIQQVQQHTNPTNWAVLPAKQSHFLQSLFGGIFLAVIGLAAAGYLVLNPDFVVGLGALVTMSSLFTFWRIVDFVFCAVAVAAAGVIMRDSISGMATHDQQMLVLTPEGFVMRKGTTSKLTSAVAYANVGVPSVVVQSGTTYLMMSRANGQGPLRLEVDGRFGPPKQIAKRIIDAHQLYAQARAGH